MMDNLKLSSGKKYAIIVSCNKYASLTELNCAAKYAEYMAITLLKLGFETKLFADLNANSEPISKTIKDAIINCCARLEPQDFILCYFSCYTNRINYDTILFVSDSNINDINSCIRINEVMQHMRKSSQKCLLIIDGCNLAFENYNNFSTLNLLKDLQSNEFLNEPYEFLNTGNGFGLLYSFVPKEAHESCKHGIVTQIMLEALLGGKDVHPLNKITFFSMKNYVTKKASTYKALNEHIQISFAFAGVNDLVICDKVLNRLNTFDPAPYFDENLAMPSNELKKVFFSYCWKCKKEDVRQIADFVRKNEFKVWLDMHEMEGGESLFEEIVKGIDNSKAIVVFLSPEYLNSSNCCKEIELAGAWNKFIIPVLLSPLPNNLYPPKHRIAIHLAGKVYIDFTSNIDATILLKQIIKFCS